MPGPGFHGGLCRRSTHAWHAVGGLPSAPARRATHGGWTKRLPIWWITSFPKSRGGQWVLSFPKRRHYFLHQDVRLVNAILRIFLAELEAALRSCGLDVPGAARFGAVSFVHRPRAAAGAPARPQAVRAPSGVVGRRGGHDEQVGPPRRFSSMDFRVRRPEGCLWPCKSAVRPISRSRLPPLHAWWLLGFWRLQLPFGVPQPPRGVRPLQHSDSSGRYESGAAFPLFRGGGQIEPAHPSTQCR